MKHSRYGAFPSPLSADILTDQASFHQLFTDQSSFYFSASIPSQQGRVAIYKVAEGNEIKECLPQGVSAKSKAHEYGGGSACAGKQGLYYVDANDQDIYLFHEGPPRKIVTDPAVRFADLKAHPNGAFLYAVQEDHSRSTEIVNTLILVTLDKQNETQVIHSGHDFYAKPRISPDGKKLAFLAWDLPQMPWDATLLYEADITEHGTLANVTKIAGSDTTSISEVEYAPDGTLYFSHDKSGYWNIATKEKTILAADADYGAAHWAFGHSRLAFVIQNGSYRIVTVSTKKAIDTLSLIDPVAGTEEQVETGLTAIVTLAAHDTFICIVGASPKEGLSLFCFNIATREKTLLHSFDATTIDEKILSLPEPFENPYGFFYPPKNDACTFPTDEKPPLLISIHGGPTGHRDTGRRLVTHYYTSRGFAVFELNYRGSTGYGRDYRRALYGHWGEYDLEDLFSAARQLKKSGLIDPSRICLLGASAGGFTALNAIATAPDFAAAIAICPVTNLTTLPKSTHKFESKMLEQLVGLYPEEKLLYLERSPCEKADAITTPTFLIHGTEDTIVPQIQSEEMYSHLLAKNIPVAYLELPGDGHLIRKKENVIRMHTGILEFLQTILGIPSEEKRALFIDNLG